MGPKTVEELMQQAEELKEQLWYFMDVKKNQHEGVKSSMNELLDLIEELAL